MTLTPEDMKRLMEIRTRYEDLIRTPDEPPVYGRINLAYRESVPYLLGTVAILMNRLSQLSPPIEYELRCSGCAFFHGATDQDGVLIGDCRRYPPTCTDGDCSWPTIAEDDYCGEFNPLAGAEEDEE